MSEPVVVKIGGDDVSYKKALDSVVARARKSATEINNATKQGLQGYSNNIRKFEQDTKGAFERIRRSGGGGGGDLGPLSFIGKALITMQAVKAAAKGIELAFDLWQARQDEINGKIKEAYEGYLKVSQGVRSIPILGQAYGLIMGATRFSHGQGTTEEAWERGAKTPEEERQQQLNNAKRMEDSQKRLRDAKVDTIALQAQELDGQEKQVALLDVEMRKQLNAIEEKKKGETNLGVLEQLDQQRKLIIAQRQAAEEDAVALKVAKERYELEQLRLEIEEKRLRVRGEGVQADVVAAQRRMGADIYGITSAAGGSSKVTDADIQKILLVMDRFEAERGEIMKQGEDRIAVLKTEARQAQLNAEIEGNAAELLASKQFYDQKLKDAQSYEQRHQVLLERKAAQEKILMEQSRRQATLESQARQARFRTQAAGGTPGAGTAAELEALRSQIVQDVAGAKSPAERAAIIARAREELSQVALHATAGKVSYSGLVESYKNLSSATLSDRGSGPEAIVRAMREVGDTNKASRDLISTILILLQELAKKPVLGVSG